MTVEKATGRQVFALAIVPGLVRVAREHGYALAVHGSLARDFDFIACPWTDDAVEADALVEALRAHVGGIVSGGSPHSRPHGRLGWAMHISPEVYIDLSVMPKSAGRGRQEAREGVVGSG